VPLDNAGIPLSPKDRDQGGGEAMMSESLPSEGAPTGIGGGQFPNDALNFQTDLFTGRFTYRVPILVAPGRGNSQLNVVLGYGSSGGNGWCGVGWGLDMGYIQRQTRFGVPRKWSGVAPLNEYDDAYGFEFSFQGVSSRLVNVTGNEYRAEIDNGAFLKFIYNNPSWTVTDKSGNKYYFGEATASRMENTKFTAGLGKSTFRWGLSRVQDVNGNETELTYTKDGNLMYLSQITYNENVNTPTISGTHTVTFTLEDRLDDTITFLPGYRVETRKRLKEIQVKIGATNVRKYVLSYSISPCMFRSRLASITQYGSDFTTALPALTFTYQDKPFTFDSIVDWPTLGSITDSNATVSGWGSPRAQDWMKGSYVELLDMDNDGLPDRAMREWQETREWDAESQMYIYTQFLDFTVQRNTRTNLFGTLYEWNPYHTEDITSSGWSSPRAQGTYGTYVDMVDINGDGLPDRVMIPETGVITSWIVQTNVSPGVFSTQFNLGSITNESASSAWRHIRAGSPDTYVDLMDMNADGWVDRVARKLSSPYDRFKVQINNGTGFNALTDWATLSSQGQTSTNWNSIYAMDTNGCAYVGMYDINGDGLPDRVMRKVSSPYDNFVVQFNNGAGFETSENWGPLSSQGQTTPEWNSPVGATNGVTFSTLIDMNGDGLLDRVMRKTTSSYDRFKVQFNTGATFTNMVSDWTGLNSEAGTGNQTWQSPVVVSNNETLVELTDINGDGFPDRVMRKLNSPYEKLKVQLSTLTNPPDVLTRVQNGIGGRVDVAYTVSTKFDNRDRPWSGDPWASGAKSLLSFPVYTASYIIVQDGFGSVDTNTYTYAGGMYDWYRREFRGFHRVTATDGLGTTTKTSFHQGGGTNDTVNGEYQDQTAFSKQGIPYRVEVWGSDGLKYSQTLNKVEEAVIDADGWYFPFVSQTIAMEYEGLGSYRATAKQFLYDTATGNLIKETALGEVSGVNISAHTFTDAGTDSVYTHITYASLSNADIKNKPASVKITSDSAGATKLRETTFTYDGSRGNLTKQLSWISGSLYATNSVGYDQYGNATSATNAVGIATTTSYDSTYKQFPVTQITGTFTNEADFDVRSGAVTTAMDAKGLVSSNSFDVFFRLKETWIGTNAFGNPVLWRAKLDYNLGGITSGISYNYVRRRVNDAVDATNGHETYTYADGLGRVVQTRVEAETGQYRVTDGFYDDRGNQNFVTLPYFSSGSGFTAYASQPGTQTTFDPIGRVASIIPPAGDTGSPTGTSTTSYKDGTDPWAQVVTDAENKTRKAYNDAYGRTIQIVEVTGGGSYNTYYQYDKVGNLTNVTDNAGNKTWMNYDALGRKTSMTDPDMGTWTYSYDNAGRLTQQIDAKNQKLKFIYNDQIGRLTSKEIRNSSDTLVATITYTYDSSLGDPAYTVLKGQLFRVMDREGWQKFSYDARGRVLKSARYLTVNGQTYVTESTYDNADRVSQLTYPFKKTRLQYTYDTGGNLVKVESLCGTGANEVFYFAQGFNALGQLTGYTNGNGVVTTYSYFTNTKRLQRIQAVKTGIGTHQDLTYTYDKVSNIKSIGDAVYTGSASAALSSISYDDLHRLTGFTRNGSNLSFTYNAIGNITVNSEFGTGTYSYSGTKPHAVTSANGKNYLYDSCGNMTNRNGQVLIYDEENRLVQVTGTNTVTLGYADDGMRLWKSSGGTLTLWIGGIYEVKVGSQTLCHVFAGGMRIASFEPINPACAWMYQDGLPGRCYRFAVAALDWPLSEGRTPYTVMLIPLLGVLGGSIYGRRICRKKAQETRKHVRFLRFFVAGYPVWRQGVCVLLVVALFFSTTTQVEAVTCSPVFWYYHGDHLGSSSVMTDRSGNLARHFEYGAFGTTRYADATCTFSPSNRYTGQILDEDTGLYYYNARYYDPELGRFVQADTIVPEPSNPQTLNRYSYVLNNPLAHTDPSGHGAIGKFLKFLGGVLGGILGAIPSGMKAFNQFFRGTPLAGASGPFAYDLSLTGGMGEQLREEYSKAYSAWKMASAVGIGNYAGLSNTGGIAFGERGGTFDASLPMLAVVGLGLLSTRPGVGEFFDWLTYTSPHSSAFDRNAAQFSLALSAITLGFSLNYSSFIAGRLARVVDARFANSPTLGAPGASDVFVVAADDIAGISRSSDLAQRLSLVDSAGNLRQGPFAIIEFDTPASELASPVFRSNPGFVPGGRTGGGAREFVIPNLQVNQAENVTIRFTE
jgi:RHS repeat-associated protein